MKAMESIHDLIEEAKLRTVWWILCVFVVTYFLTHTSKSMLMNIPVALFLVAGARILVNEVEFRRRIRQQSSTSYLSHLEKKQLAVNDSRLSTVPQPVKWKRKVDSPVVETALEDFINNILRDFVVDLWYSEITPDREAPALIHALIMDVLGEVSGRVKELNLVDLLTKDVVELVGDHLDLFRRNQAAIGVDVMKTLSSEERDERLKHHLLSSKELHPALISPDCEYKVLQRLMGGVIAVVLKPREAQCPLVRSIARELLTCLVMQPVMNFATPMYINELIECIILAYHNEGSKDASTGQSPNVKDHSPGSAVSGGHGQSSESNSRKVASSNNKETDLYLSRSEHKKEPEPSISGNLFSSTTEDEPMHPRPADWAKAMEAATQRRSEVLMPENLENMWTIGRNYKKKLQKKGAPGLQATQITKSGSATLSREDFVTETSGRKSDKYFGTLDKTSMQLPPLPQQDPRPTSLIMDVAKSSVALNEELFPKGGLVYELGNTESAIPHENRNKLRKSNSTSDLKLQTNVDEMFTIKDTTAIINEYYSADRSKPSANKLKSSSDVVIRTEGMQIPKLRCRVLGAYFERLGSKSFAVYSIAVTDADNNTWFVKRRYSNFERLHRHLKEIPNYTLHLPPKRIFSSSTEDAFVHQRCIQLDKYLQDLLSIANVAEQHEVWDFLSDSSKNYSFGKSSSVMRTLAVNVDDAVDDIVRQFKGVSDGLIRAVAGQSSYGLESSITSRNLNWDTDEQNKLVIRQNTSESINSYSDTDDGEKYTTHGRDDPMSASQAEGWRSDNELDLKGNPTIGVKYDESIANLDTEEIHGSRSKSESSSRVPDSSLALTTVPQVDLTGVPPEWTPPNLSVPVLNLVDNIFQLKRRGWLRRQVFWISKQILQLVMEDAIDDWLLRQIQLLRREDVITYGIRWVHDVLWPGGIFFRRLRIQDQIDNLHSNTSPQQRAGQPGGGRGNQPGSFEEQLEAARRASDVKKMIFTGAPATLVSLIGHKQYRRCARDMYYFLQSTVCLKQLGYGILELILISVFPELRDLVRDIHEKAHFQSV